MSPEALRAFMEVHGLTKAEAARRMYMTTRGVEYYLSGQRSVDAARWFCLVAKTLSPGASAKIRSASVKWGMRDGHRP